MSDLTSASGADGRVIHKNWPAICRIDDAFLKMTVAMRMNFEFLQEYVENFPEFFVKQRPERCPPYPLSVVQAEFEKKAKRKSTEDWLVARFGIPTFRMGPLHGLATHPSILTDNLERLATWYATTGGFPRSLEHFCFDGREYFVCSATSKNKGWIYLLACSFFTE